MDNGFNFKDLDIIDSILSSSIATNLSIDPEISDVGITAGEVYEER